MNRRTLLVWNSRTWRWWHRNTRQTAKHKSNLEYYLMLKKRSSPPQLMLGAMLCWPVTNRKAKQKWQANIHNKFSFSFKYLFLYISISSSVFYSLQLINTRSCNYSCTSSWWWVSIPETCRAAYRNIINWISRILLDSYWIKLILKYTK